MTDKSYVTLEQHRCTVCSKTYDTGNLLLDKRLRATFDRHTVTGFGLCPECEAKRAGYIAMIGCDPTRTPAGTHVKPGEVYRTGRVLHIKREAWPRIFGPKLPMPEDGICICDDALLTTLIDRAQEQANA
jgi:hypothetical protein